jgi:hypothetical protein
MPRFGLSATQLIATALAAVTATIAASYLGVSGTVIGAAVASVVGAVGNAVYAHSLRRTQDRVREVVPVRRPGTPARNDRAPLEPPLLPAPAPRVRRGANPWRGVALGSIAVFVAVLAVITGVEVVAGRPISDLVRGDTGSGTSLFGETRDAAGSGRGGVPTVTKTVVPSVVVTTPTVTQTAPAVTRTATPTVTTTPPVSSTPPTTAAPTTSSATPTGSPSPLG